MLSLIVLNDYADSQQGYESATRDGAVHVVAQGAHVTCDTLPLLTRAIKVAADCLGSDLAIGIVNTEGKYTSITNG